MPCQSDVVDFSLGENEALREIIDKLMNAQSPNMKNLARLKTEAAARHRLENIPSNSQIIRMLEPEEKRRLLPLLRRKATRTLSGVTIIAVMTKPQLCPQTEPCAYCPGGPTYNVPQSYTGFEPAAMRGIQNKFDPYLQVRSRIEQLQAIGHKVDKIELIIMGGTFPATRVEYQTWFIRRCIDAITGKQSTNLEEAKKNAEDSTTRNVGITVETRPDWAKETHVDLMLNMGITRVEMGVQNPSDEIYRLVGRTHTVKDVTEATRVVKDAGLKLVYHIMPGLPSSNMKEDLEVFRRIFSSPQFRPDMIKIYPCLVLKGTRTYEWYTEGEYKPYMDEEAVNLILQVKKIVPPWIRIMRVQRDIPAPLIVAGVKMSNLRQAIQQRLRVQNMQCRCIRCREAGHKTTADIAKPSLENAKILTTRYEASEGEELFISAEEPEKDMLIGYLRLRIPSEKVHRPELARHSCSIVRELHVYGPLVPVGKHSDKAWQHRGCGKILLAEAERATRRDYGFKKILVISALGTKQYYMRFGYERDGVYMSKTLEN